jgi:parallel beta-helix repeat protein
MRHLYIGLLAFLLISLNLNAQSPYGSGIDNDLLIASGDSYSVDQVKSAVVGENPLGSNSINVLSTAGFSIGDEILLITMQDSTDNSQINKTGTYEYQVVSSISENTIFLNSVLKNSYNANESVKHQVVRVPNFNNVTIEGTMTCSTWDGSTGGILCFRASGIVKSATGTGIIDASGKGYRGGSYNTSTSPYTNGYSGESFTKKPSEKSVNYKDINKGGGASGDSHNEWGAKNDYTGGGGGGSYGSLGSAGQTTSNGSMGGWSGEIYGTNTLDKVFMGSGGGGTGVDDNNGRTGARGGNGGGVILIYCLNFEDVAVNCLGANGVSPSDTYSGSQRGGSGGGSGGSVLINTRVFSIVNAEILAHGGTGGSPISTGGNGGNGGDGRIRINANSSVISNTISPSQFSGSMIIHNPLTFTENYSNPYDINVDIYDDFDLVLNESKIFYNVNGGVFIPVNLISLGNNLYKSQIPPQVPNSVVNYYIEVSQGEEIYTFPENAPTQILTFTISGENPQAYLECDENGIVKVSWDEITNPNLIDFSVYRSQTADFIPGPDNLVASGITENVFLNSGLQDALIYYYKVSANYNLDGSITNSYSDEVSILVDNTNLTTVYGYVLLEGHTNYSGIKVKFNPVSPSAVLDSVYTDENGYFRLPIVNGVYKISSYKAFFADYISPEISFIEDTKNNTIKMLSVEGGTFTGNINGIWPKNYYGIYGNVRVPSGDSLIIEAGSVVRFYGNYNFIVDGYLELAGNLSDTIKVSRGYPHITPEWGGFDFSDLANDNSFINLSIIEYACDGVYAINSKPTISNSLFRNNSNSGIYCNTGAHLKISNIEITGNTSYGMHMRDKAAPEIDNSYIHHVKTGIKTDNAHPHLVDTRIKHNSNNGIVLNNSSNPTIDNCDLSFNNHSGIYLRYNYASFLIKNSRLNDNISYGVNFSIYGGGIFENCEIARNGRNGLNGHTNNSITLSNNKIHHNNGSGFSFYGGTVTIKNNIISDNNGDGIIKTGESTTKISYNTIFGNSGDGIEINQANNNISNNIIVNNGDFGIRTNSNSFIENFTHNNLFLNGGGAISDLNKFNPLHKIWVFESNNVNGTSADIYLNISEEPSFADPANNNFILRAESKCINAGSVSVLDPDGTISDQGAIYRDLGNPHKVNVLSYDQNAMNISWHKVELDSLIAYKVFYKLNTDADYTFFQQTTDTFITVTGLQNALLHDFSIKGVYPSYESGYSPKASGIPGLPAISFNPPALNLTCPSTIDTLTQVVRISNPGTRHLNIDIGEQKGYGTFDGSGDYVNAGNPAQYNGLTEFTMETWLRRRNNGHFDFMGKHYRQYSFYVDGNNYLGVYKGHPGNHKYFTSAFLVPSNTWLHVAVTWKSNIITFYVNGKEEHTFTNANKDPIPEMNYNFQLGRRSDYNGYYLDGDLAEAKLWNYARTKNEIYNDMYSKPQGGEVGLIGYWPMRSDFNDHSVYMKSSTIYGNAKIQESELDYLGGFLKINPRSFMLMAGESKDITLKFPRRDLGSLAFQIPLTTDMESDPDTSIEASITYGQGVPSTPLHFISVPVTNRPYTIIITDAIIDGVKIAPGDEIGVFDGDLCVGSGIFDGSFNFRITVWEENSDPVLPGYHNGNPLSFKIYDASADLEASTFATYIIGDGNFGYREFSSLMLNGTVFRFQSVPLNENIFSLISFNMLPRRVQSSIIFNDLSGLKIVYDDKGRAIIPEYSINSIGDIDFRKAYHIFSTEIDTILFEGTPINPANWDITLEAAKWNSVAYIGGKPEDVTSVFPESVRSLISIVQSSEGGAWIPEQSINTLGSLKPGMGYQIAITGSSPAVFNYQTSTTKKSVSKVENIDPQYFKFEKTGLPYNVVIDIPIDKAGLSINDEIGIFDEERCVGAAVYNGESRISITAWEGNAQYNLKGFISGNPIILKGLKGLDQTIFNLTAEGVGSESQMFFKSGFYSHLQLIGNATSLNNFAVFDVKNVYPNPCMDKLNVSVSLNKSSNLTIKICDLLGRACFLESYPDQLAGNKIYELDLSALKYGTYFMTIGTENSSGIKYKVIKQP